MNHVAQDVFKQALDLAPVDRAVLIEELLHSFDADGGDGIGALWSEEVESRIAGYDAGEITADSLAAVVARLDQR